MNKKINNNKRKILSFVAYLFLVILLLSSYSFAQEFVTINYKDKEYIVVSDMVCLDIKENFYNQKLIDK
jgi:hypothetical protein